MSSSLRVLHFNDAYRVGPQKTSHGRISVTQFAYLLASLTADQPEKPLVLFSGDLFSPSVESTITRGSHMVPVMNVLSPDVALTGNHEFDFGYAHLAKLVKDCKFPWILSNIYDTKTGSVPEALHEFIVLDRFGLKIGVIGLVEKDWIASIPSWPSNFEWRDMEETGVHLSRKLRDIDGDWACDIIIALTHSRIPNDINLAKALFARPSSACSVGSKHGVDLILGGHDHIYYASKGCHSWEGYDIRGDVPLGTEDDDGVLVIKSGTDFRELSEIIVELEDGQSNSVRRKLIRSVNGKKHVVAPQMATSKDMENVLEKVLSSVISRLSAPLCRTLMALDVRSETVRTGESAAGNWFADILRHAYDEELRLQGLGGVHGVLICSGTLRGDSVYGPGVVTLGNILDILPYDDPVVVLEVDDTSIWDSLESSLSAWPAQEGRFPVLSAFRVTWDSRRLPRERVVDVSIDREDSYENRLEKVVRGGGKRYKIVTRQYMAQGHDGYEALKGQRYLIDDEHGTLMSTLVTKYLLGSQLTTATSCVLSRTTTQRQRTGRQKIPINHVVEAQNDVSKVFGCKSMRNLDCCEDNEVQFREEAHEGELDGETTNLIEVTPTVDGRLIDVARK